MFDIVNSRALFVYQAVLSIDAEKGKPSALSIAETAHTLARYAAICQENRLVGYWSWLLQLFK